MPNNKHKNDNDKKKTKPKKLNKKKSDKSEKSDKGDKERTKRKSSERRSSVKKTWERFVQQSDSRSLLKDIWKSENPTKEYSDKINKLHKKYCS